MASSLLLLFGAALGRYRTLLAVGWRQKLDLFSDRTEIVTAIERLCAVKLKNNKHFGFHNKINPPLEMSLLSNLKEYREQFLPFGKIETQMFLKLVLK